MVEMRIESLLMGVDGEFGSVYKERGEGRLGRLYKNLLLGRAWGEWKEAWWGRLGWS